MINAATQSPWLRIVTVSLLIIGAAACWIFIARYWLRFRWWKNQIGRNLIAMSACLGAFYTYAAAYWIWPDIPGRIWIRGTLFLAITATVVWRLVMFERVSKRTDREQSVREGDEQ